VINSVQRIFNVPLIHDLLREIATAVGNDLLGNVGLVSYTVYLPNRRSCCEFRRHLRKYLEDNVAVATLLPTIRSIADELSCEDMRILLLMVRQLKSDLKNESVPASSIFTLAKKLSEFFQILLLEDIDYHQLFQIIPDHLKENLMHTFYLLQNCLENVEISAMIAVMKAKLQSTIHESNFNQNGHRIVAIGIEGANRITRIFLDRVASSVEGRIYNICGMNGISDQLENNNDGMWTGPCGNVCSENHIEFCEFNNLSGESFAIAIAIRKAIAENKSVLVVSPSRSLAEKVRHELRRWNIIINDSTGVQFAKTPAGAFVAQLLKVIDKNFPTPDVMVLLKIALMGRVSAVSSSKSCESSSKTAELVESCRTLLAGMEMFFRSRAAIPSDFFEAFALWQGLQMSGTENNSLVDEKSLPVVVNLVQKLKIIAEEISSSMPKRKYFLEWYSFCCGMGDLLLGRMESGFTDTLFHEFIDMFWHFLKHSKFLGSMTFTEFTIFVKNHLLTASARTPSGHTPGVVMVGIMDAQLLEADFVIIAGANDINFSVVEQNDFWITQSMLKILGIQTVDKKNEFIQRVFERLVRKNNVLITMSRIIDGVQRPCYRFFEKLKDELKIHHADWLERLVINCNIAQHRINISFVAPNPSLQHRPKQLSISDVRLLMNNPYGLYVKKILHLKELPPLGFRGNVRGNFIHGVMDKIVKSDIFTQNVDLFHDIGERLLKDTWLSASDFGLWYFRLKNIFSFVVANLPHNGKSMSEVPGEYFVEVGMDYRVKISGILDRIDLKDDGSMTIVDYKSGIVPLCNHVICGRAPQLVIEAIMAHYGIIEALCDTHHSRVSSLQYWRLNGTGSGGEIHVIAANPEEVDRLMDGALEGLKKIITQYNIIGIPYDVNVQYSYDAAHCHLARVKEWSRAYGM
jgi:ATP-dependent helicase/nuclease subunit B